MNASGVIQCKNIQADEAVDPSKPLKWSPNIGQVLKRVDGNTTRNVHKLGKCAVKRREPNRTVTDSQLAIHLSQLIEPVSQRVKLQVPTDYQRPTDRHEVGERATQRVYRCAPNPKVTTNDSKIIELRRDRIAGRRDGDIAEKDLPKK